MAHSKAVGTCLEAAKELSGSGIDVEVINLRSLRPLGTFSITFMHMVYKIYAAA